MISTCWLLLPVMGFNTSHLPTNRYSRRHWLLNTAQWKTRGAISNRSLISSNKHKAVFLPSPQPHRCRTPTQRVKWFCVNRGAKHTEVVNGLHKHNLVSPLASPSPLTSYPPLTSPPPPTPVSQQLTLPPPLFFHLPHHPRLRQA